MKATLTLFLMLTGLGLSPLLHAEQIFVLFDGSCGERIRYEQAVSNLPRQDYFAYGFTLAGGNRLLLETGNEGGVTQSYLPQGYLYCNDPRLNLQLADRVASGADRVFILLPTQQGQYLVQPVVMAATLQRSGTNLFTYQSPLTAFQFDTQNGIIGVNLTYNRPSNKVYFEGRDNNACNGVYLFRQLSVGSAYPVIDYQVVPEIGVTERRLGSDGKTTSGGVIVAREVNGQPVGQFLSANCAALTALVSGAPAPAPGVYSNQPVSPYANPAPPAYQPPAPVNPTPTALSAPTVQTLTHTVTKGETLYAISRKYATTPDAIRASNGLTSNTLFPGQQLRVSTTAAPPAAAVATTPPAAPPTNPTVPRIPYNPGSVAGSNPGAPAPTPYGAPTAPAAPRPYGSEPTARGGEAVYGEDVHVVQPGETVASVALKYGYTAAKFREMNDLGANQVIRVGERLRTRDCNCPATTPGPVPPAAPQPYGTAPAAPPAFTPAPAPAPRPYGSTPATPAGTEVGSTVPSYRAPQNYQPTAPAPAAPTAPARPTISNDPNFGQVVPNPAAVPTTTLSQLETRGTPAAAPTTSLPPATYGTAPQQPTYPQRTYPSPVGSPAPSAAPTAYGGTPLTPGQSYDQPAHANPNRSFHVVQEGESLYAIAQRYGLAVDQLRQLNQLAPGEVIVPFQKLYLN